MNIRITKCEDIELLYHKLNAERKSEYIIPTTDYGNCRCLTYKVVYDSLLTSYNVSCSKDIIISRSSLDSHLDEVELRLNNGYRLLKPLFTQGVDWVEYEEEDADTYVRVIPALLKLFPNDNVEGTDGI